MKNLSYILSFLICVIGCSGNELSGSTMEIYVISDGFDAYEPNPINITVTEYRRSTYQLWFFEPSISGSFNIKNLANDLYLQHGKSCNSYENLIVSRYTGNSNQRFQWNVDKSISPVCDGNLILGTLHTTPAKGVFVPRTQRSLSHKFIAKSVLAPL